MGELSIIGLKVQTSITRSGNMWIPKYFSGVDEDRCKACGECTRVCPRGLLQPNGGKKPVILNEDSCIGCSACMNICPNKAAVCNIKKRTY